MRVVVTGATGFVGQRLVRALSTRGADVVALTRSESGQGARRLAALPRVRVRAWSGRPGNAEAWFADVDGADAVVNLAGEPVMGGRWTDTHKARVLASRLDAARAVYEAIDRAQARPSVVVNASAIGIYGFTGDERLDEEASPGNDFLADVCVRWEAEARKVEALGPRVVLLRIGIVLGEDGGAIGQMLLPFKLGVGGRIGDGRQWMSWVHVDDVIGLTLHAIDRADLRGPVNVTAPEPVRNSEFTKAFGRALHRPTLLPVPTFGLRALFGEAADVLIRGQRVVPAAALGSGYAFRHADLRAALADVT